jgi:hypothetical protein
MSVPASIAIKLHAVACAGGAVVRLRLGAAGRRAHAADEPVHPGATGTTGGGDHRRDAEAGAGLAHLAYEVLNPPTVGTTWGRSMFVELDTRRGDGLMVTLECDRDTGHTQIVVHDMRSDD